MPHTRGVTAPTDSTSHLPAHLRAIEGTLPSGSNAAYRMAKANAAMPARLRREGVLGGTAGFNDAVQVWTEDWLIGTVGEYIDWVRRFQARVKNTAEFMGVTYPADQDYRYVARRWRANAGKYTVGSKKAGTQRWVDQNGNGIGVRGVESWVASVDAAYRDVVIREVDTAVAKLAWDAWFGWPFYSGYSRGNLRIEWLMKGPDLVARFHSHAPYTLAVKQTNHAYQRARKNLAAVTAAAAARISAAKLTPARADPGKAA